MSLTKLQRSKSWNVDFFNFSLRVGGVFQCADMLSVADIAHELNICFVCNLPPDESPASLVPALLLKAKSAQKLIILDQDDENPFPTPTTGIHSYEYVFHRDCCVHGPGDLHEIRDTCVYRQPNMVERRSDQRYIDIGSKSTDARFADFPTRSSSQSRAVSQSRTSSLKRDSSHSSRSTSPAKTVTTIPDKLSLIPQNERTEMNRIMNQYAANVLLSCPSCVITGEGSYLGFQGPGLEAAHIVPQSHWNVYPINGCVPDPSDFEELKLAWRGTWDADGNGIMLLSTLHRCFNARLIAFHPKTHIIRAFINYSTINKYHGQKVELPPLVPEAVWQHHWDVCCLENTVGATLAWPNSLTDIPELPSPKARKLDYGEPTKQGLSSKATDSQANSQATDTPATDSEAFSQFMYNRAHPPSPPLSERAKEGGLWPFGKQTLNDPDTVQQVLGGEQVLEEINEYGRGRPRKRKQCTASKQQAEGLDGAHGAKKQKLELSPGTPSTGL